MEDGIPDETIQRFRDVAKRTGVEEPANFELRHQALGREVHKEVAIHSQNADSTCEVYYDPHKGKSYTVSISKSSCEEAINEFEGYVEDESVSPEDW